MSAPRRIAYFISPHGYGHAARSAAIMEALAALEPGMGFELFTQVPRWFFEESLSGPFGYHDLLTDIGLAQQDSLTADLPETGRRLAALLPFDAARLTALADEVLQAGCRMIVCDIAPLGIAVAQAAGLPSVLIENFTWDWIYADYLATAPELGPYAEALGAWFALADYHIQTAPICQPGIADLTTAPVSRESRVAAAETRQRLGIPEQAPLVLLTMGGIPWDYAFLDQLADQRDIHFVIPGGAEQLERRGNLLLLPQHAAFYHPDLMQAATAVIGKLGYSTLAECYRAGIPYGYVPRPGFRESPPLAAFVEEHMRGLAIQAEEFASGAWLTHLPPLLEQPRLERREANGAEAVARFLLQVV